MPEVNMMNKELERKAFDNCEKYGESFKYATKNFFSFLKLLLSIAILLLSNNIVSAQCNVQTTKISSEIDRYTVIENFYKNEDLENGIENIYLSTNLYGNSSSGSENKAYITEIVVTYIWSGYKKEFIPNRLKIQLPSGKQFTLTAEEMSRGTIDLINRAPHDVNTIECKFDLPIQITKQLLSEKRISTLLVTDYKTGSSFDLSNKYRGQIQEMLLCVIKHFIQ